ncbi:MAG TPA: trehalose-phosphatase [Solirubrobacterales bacterium]|nr:trehalose-phosphatase [Solirubrobacterales bacterium]HMW44356.1 trehalose-phosphatase [Solirubrobacterales bacterium]HMX70219.1 trehalose-phosphatase [Solirubrobacterales bacterium]HMY25871.1 trehalose-phosphatase [Solirubrobacterales bacterium]HNA24579.1 trehalose-phosphatase [Solirubrobacterales bacterium]
MTGTDSPLSVLLEDPANSALMSDVDGTLCRIVDRPDQARVPVRARESLETLADHLALVACITGRPSPVARKMVGAKKITYFGNHGLSFIKPGQDRPTVVIEGEEAERARNFIRENDNPFWVTSKIRIEDKGPIQALHWRGAGHRTEEVIRGIADHAQSAGLATHWGRKVLELRPPGMEGKAGAVDELLDGTDIDTVVFAGDDRTDYDAAVRLKKLADEGQLKRLLLVAIDSDEGPPELVELADLVVAEPEEWIDLIEGLAGTFSREPAEAQPGAPQPE